MMGRAWTDREKILSRLVPCPCACRTGRGTTGGGLERSFGQDSSDTEDNIKQKVACNMQMNERLTLRSKLS